MSKEFLKPPMAYKSDEEIDTPYLRARQEWDERFGSIVTQCKNWRLSSIASNVVSLLLASLCFYVVTKPALPPLVIRIDDVGRPESLGRAGEFFEEPGLQETKYFLGKFIENVRSVSADPVVVKNNWLTAYKFLSKEATVKLNAMTNSDSRSALKSIGTKTVVVELISVVEVGSSFQARWKESLFDKSGGLADEYNMTGVFTVEVSASDDETFTVVNPLGLIITNFSWTREL